MDVKRYDLVGEYECDIQELEDGDYVLYDDIKHLLTRPDHAEVERLVDEIIRLSKLCEKALWSRTIEKSVEYELALDKARADLLKLVGGE